MDRSERVKKRLDEWKRKLVDLTRRNRLLYFESGRGSTMEVAEPEIDDFFVSTYEHQRRWRVWEPPDENDHEEQQQATSTRALFGDLSTRRKPRREDEVKLTPVGKRSWAATLNNLRGRARTAFEEAGLQILHLAVGLLEWREQETSSEVHSPIILLPVELRRESRRAPYTLGVADEDPVLNPALAIRLDQDFNLALPPLPDDWSAVPPTGYLEQIAAVVADFGWTVRTDAYLSLFSFLKLVIYKDLEANESTIGSHTIIRTIAGEVDARPAAGDLPRAVDLDHTVEPRETYLVVDADSSQLAALQAVKKGHSLVLQGPPGTGKSQTITNILAEAVAEGKSVLFVSQKMAALDVVLNRLKAVHLDRFCLELHSHKANKREVIHELYRTYTERLEPRHGMSDEEYARLVSRRKALNEYVGELHRRREPLARSVYEVLAELVQLHSVPSLQWEFSDAATLTPERLSAIAELAKRLERVWPVVLEEGFPWRGCLEEKWGPDVRERWLRTLSSAREAATSLHVTAKALASACYCPTPSAPRETEWLIRTAGLLEQSPAPPRHWLVSEELDRAQEEAARWLAETRSYRQVKARLLSTFSTAVLGLRPGLLRKLEHTAGKLGALLGVEPRNAVDSRRALARWAEATLLAIPGWGKATKRICAALAIAPHAVGLEEAARLARLTLLIGGPDRPPPNWLGAELLTRVERGIKNLQSLYDQHDGVKRDVLTEYDEAVQDLDVNGLLQRFVGPYGNPLRWLRPQYYRDRASLRACRLDGAVPRDPVGDLKKVRSLMRLHAEIQIRRREWRELLGRFDQGPGTDFEPARRAIETAREIFALIHSPEEKVALEAVLRAERIGGDLAEIASRLEGELRANRELMSGAAMALPPGPVPHLERPLAALALDDLGSWVRQVRDVLSEATKVVEDLEVLRRDGTAMGMSYEEACSALADLESIHAFECELARQSDRLRATYGHFFVGVGTEWDKVLAALRWASEMRQHFGGRRMPEGFLDLAIREGAQNPAIQPCSDQLLRAEEVLRDLSLRFSDNETISRIGDLSATWEEVDAYLAALSDRVDGLRDWIDLRDLRSLFTEMQLDGLLRALESMRIPVTHVVSSVRKALLQSWYGDQLRRLAVLRQFRAEEHETLIGEFRELDRRQWEIGSHRVIAAANQRRPGSDFVEPGGEAALLLKEANKARKHLPVRQLLERIPLLVRQLKPVVMMSPISVSQYLPSKTAFDLVVFDEASQVFPEDAVGSIYRAQQVVVCGDSKQLPPTDFFAIGENDEEEEREEDLAEATDVYQSILEELAGAGLAQLYLLWHYRSRHESLVTFSNGRFYDYRLITFPAPIRLTENLGIRFEFVKDGVYDRGRTRTNRREADVVANLVYRHYMTRPGSTLGVVAFSEPQKDVILQAKDAVLERNPELEPLLREDDRLRGFFVKNLENVQGDERDVMIFSVGYGRDAQGLMAMNFGPLNRSGGERRLNVAITRAREQVIVVSSIHAGDIDVARTRAPGALLLRAYLDYAERGVDALAIPSDLVGGEPESPLEVEVASEIRQMGYEVLHQVGCSRFRIDLGVLDPAAPGRFILGVECDGATYHSAATARDRDRLRDEVLRSLGWVIYRVWSPDWYSSRSREADKLRQGIERARTILGEQHQNPGMETASASKRVVSPPVVESIEIEHKRIDDLPPEVVGYEVAHLGDVRLPRPDFNDPGNRRRLADLLSEVVAVEGPIHRDLATSRVIAACGVGRAGKRIRKTIGSALRHASQCVEIRGAFLYQSGAGRTERVRAPMPDEAESARRGTHIPLDEIQLAAELVLRRAGSLPYEQTLVRLARIFGFDRLGDNIRGHFQKALREGVREGRLTIDGDLLRLPG